MATNKPVGKFNSDGITYGYRHKETLPKFLNARDVVSLASVLPRTSITPEQLLNRILVEGRGDAGVNEYNTDNKRAVDVYSKAKADGANNLSARFLAAVLDKAETSKRTGKSFDEVWNGTGRSAVTGKTGADYAARMQQMAGAATDPRNADLLDLIKRAGEGKLTAQENLALQDSQYIIGMAFGESGNRSKLTNQGNSPFMSALNKKFIDVTGKDAFNNDITWQDSAEHRLTAYIRQEAGSPLSSDDLNTLSWDKDKENNRKVFTELAREVLPIFKIQKDSSK